MKALSYSFVWIFLISISLAPSADPIVSAKQSLKNQYEDRWSGKQAPVLIAADPSGQQDLYGQAEELYKEKKYDEVIQLLSGPAYAAPSDFKLNILLARAQVEKCAILKANGDKSYKELVYEPYKIGRRLHKMDETRPEPYYIVAKSLLINNRIQRSIRTIKKALHYSPNNPEYLLVLGEGYSAMGEYQHDLLDANRYFSQAERAYEKALEKGRDIVGFKTIVEEKISELSKKMGLEEEQDFGK